MAFSQKLFTSLQNYDNPHTRIGELNRIWYDSVTNEFRIQLDTVTPGGTVVGVDLLTKANNAANIKSSSVGNLWSNTNTFGTPNWGASAATLTSTSVVTDPLGGTTAYKFVANVGADPNQAGNQQLSCNVFGTVLPIGIILTASIHVKAAEFSQLRIRNNSSGEVYTFTLGSAPTATSGVLNPQSTLVTNGWYRLSWTYVTGGIGSTTLSRGDNWSFRLASTGDGTSGIYLWGPQLEFGSVLSPYTANTTNNYIYYSPKLTFNNQTGGIGYSVNGGLYLTPAGLGGISAQAFDSTTTGGNQRGVRSVDWQMSRSAATQVTQSDYSVIGGGQNNLISSNAGQSVIAGGSNNSITYWQNFIGGGFNNSIAGQWSTITGGYQNTLNGYFNFVGTGSLNSANDQTAVTSITTTIAGTATTTLYLTAANPNIRWGLYIPINGGTNWATSVVTTTAYTITSGAISGTLFTFVSATGTITAGMVLTGSGVTANTYIVSGSGTSWTVNNSQTSIVTTATSYTMTIAIAVGVTANYTVSCLLANGVVVGGANNQASGLFSFIGNGGDGTAANRNIASGDYSIVVGGIHNQATGRGSVVIGGGLNSSGGSVSGNTASGMLSAVLSGNANSAGSTYSIVVGGYYNNASAPYSIVLGGSNGNTRGINGFVSIPASVFTVFGGASQGSNQAGILVLATQTIDATATILTSDGGLTSSTNQLALPLNSAYYFKGSVIAGVTGGGNSKSWTFDGAIKKGTANSVAFIGTPTVTSSYADAGASAWTIALSANTTNDTLTVTVTGQAATTIRWVCKIETTEMTF